MVILQFNKLIRNKWIWGAFAIAISAFFAFDFLLDDIRDTPSKAKSDVGTLAGEPIDAQLFSDIQDDIRGIGRQRDYTTDQSEINRQAWENYAAIKVAGVNGIEATEGEVMASIRRDPSFQRNGGFSFALYQSLLRDNGITPERFESSLKRRMTIARIARTVLPSATWASPMELNRAVADMTDVFTIKVASFTQSKEEADAVKLDDAGLKKWYDDNVKTLELPARVKIRYVKFDATDEGILAKMSATEDELRDRYDATIDKYTSTDTNGVEVVKKFEEVKDAIEKEVRQIAAVQFFETNISYRAYAVKPAPGVSRLDEIAKEEGLKVVTSDWFSTDSAFQEGFMKRSYQILPGAQGFTAAVADLDSENEDLRYAIILSDKAVWLVEKAEESPQHVPTFEEAKLAIRPRALKAARADAFKLQVESIAAKGVEAVLATKNVSTNYVFTVADLKPGLFPDQNAVTRAASKLNKGEISEFTSTGTGRAVLVICEDRAEGDAAKAMVLRSQAQQAVTMMAAGELPTAWMKWNLSRLGFTTTEYTSVEKAEEIVE